MHSVPLFRRLPLLSAVLLSFSCSPLVLAEDLPFSLDGLKVSDAKPASNVEQISAYLQPRTPKPAGELKVTEEGVLDPGIVEVYEQAAPAIVYVTDGETGHGTGFFIKEDGWLLTNNHVVEGMPLDPKTGVPQMRIVSGAMNEDGEMTLRDSFVEADVFRVDRRRDLALLKLRSLPDGLDEVPVIPLAKKVPPPGSTCVAIGHPSAGVLWTLRTGAISGFGKFPHDQIGGFVYGADAEAKRLVQKVLARKQSRKVVLSSCGLNPGDSGGPLLNEEGELIAVSFAGPTLDLDQGIDLGKFSFHIHLSEVQGFLKEWPQTAEVEPPPAFPAARYQSLMDLDEDEIPEAVAFSMTDEGEPVAILCDLDQDSLTQKVLRRIDEVGFDPEQDWDAEFAVVMSPRPTLFFDTDNSGAFDLVMLQDGEKWWKLTEKNGTWSRAEHTGAPIPDLPFNDNALNEALKTFLQNLSS